MHRLVKAILSFGEIKRFIQANKNFFFLWLAEMFAEASLNLILIVMSILSSEGVLSQSTKNTSVGIALILNLATLPGLVLAPFAGVLADWFSKRRIVLIVNIIRFSLLAVFVAIGGWNFLVLSYVLILILSTILQFSIPAEGGLIPQLVEKKNLLFANSLFTIDVYGTLVIDVVAAGILLSFLGIQFTFVIAAILFLASIFFISKVRIKEKHVRPHSLKYLLEIIIHLLRDAKAGLVYAFRTTVLRFALAHLFIMQIVGLTLATLIFRIGDEIFGVSPRTAGVVVLSPIAMGVLISFVLLNTIGRKRSRIKLLFIGTLFGTFSFGLMSVISLANAMLARLFIDRATAIMSLFALGFSLPFIIIPAQTLIYENTLHEFRGRIMGIWLALTASLSSVATIFVSVITDKFENITIPITLIVIVGFIYSCYLFRVTKKYSI